MAKKKQPTNKQKKKTSQVAGKGQKKAVKQTKTAAKRRTAVAAPVTDAPLVFPQWKDTQADLFRKVFYGICGFALLAMLLSSQFVGLNADEKMQISYNVNLMNYYGTFGEDKAALDMPKTLMHLYGGLFEVLSGGTARLFGIDDVNSPAFYNVRHFWNALFGFLGLFFAGLLAREIAGWRAAVLTVILLFLSPRYFGHSLMNPKDIPFAAGYIMAIYFFARVLKNLPRLRWQDLLGLTLAIGIGIGIRVGGLVVFAYMGLFLGLHFLMKMGLKNIAHPLTLRYLIAGAVPALGGIAFALLFWPYALEDPFTGLSSALGAMSAYALEVRMLFKGIMINSKEIPTSYLPTWFFLTVPLGLIVGTLLYLGFSIKIFKESNKLLVGMVALAAFFPFVYVIIKDSTLYDGWRHLIFPYTCLVVLAGVAWDYAWQRAQAAPQQWIGLAVLGVMSISVLDAAAFISRNPALSYVYFNPLAGGLSGAFGNYETDYWGVGIRQGVDWMEKEGIISEDMQDTVIVVTNFKYQLDQYVKNKYKGKVKTYYVRYRERHQRQWDYALFNSRFVSGSHIKGGNWPSKSALHSINVNGTPILGIYKNEDDLAFRAQTAVKKRDFQGALRLLSTVVERNPNDETAWESIANASLQTGQYDQAKTALDKSLAIDPESVGSHNMLGLCYMNTGKINEARTTLTKAIELNQRNSIAYYYLAQIEMQAKSYDKAIEYIEGAIQSNGRFKQAYLMAAQIYDLKGDATRAKAFRDAAAKI